MKISTILLACVASSTATAGGLDQSRYLAPVLDPEPVTTWTGVYVGVSAGTVGYRDELSGNSIADTNQQSGGLVGIDVGYGWQVDQFVVGVETDLSASKAAGSTRTGSTVHTASLDSFGSTRLRFGFAIDRALFYVTGGVAYGVTHTRETTGATYAANWSLRPGWSLGGGAEFAVTPSWIVRAEGLYAGLGLKTALDSLRHDFRFTDSLALARAGVNYKF